MREQRSKAQVKTKNKSKNFKIIPTPCSPTFNSHLGSGAGSWVNIPWLLQDTSHIYWFHLPKQTRKKNLEKRSNSQQIVFHCFALASQNPGLREVDLEPSPKRVSYKIKTLRPRRKNTRENKSCHRAWTYKREPSTKTSRLGTQC